MATTTMRAHGSPRAFPMLEFKVLDASEGFFEGYLAVFGNTDKTRDIIERGAFTKTLREAYEVKKRAKATCLYPLLWMHDPDRPVGGIYDASEDQKGLYIKGQCDLDTPLGLAAFSGMQKGYMAQLSIGYDAVKATRDQRGVRHLNEVRLWEGSVVTTGFAANAEANVLATKMAELAAHYESKGASGKSSWPLAPREREWDNGSAHNRIVAWATNEDDTLDVGKMRSVHFWSGEPADNITSYKLLFCDVIGGEVQAVPRAIMACTGSHGIQAVQGVGGDMGGIKARIAGYYHRMAREFDDDTIVVPWDAGKLAWRRAAQTKLAGGIQSLTASLASVAVLHDSITACMQILGDATGLPLDPELRASGAEGAGEGAEEASVADQLAGNPLKSPVVQPAVSILLDNLDGLKDALVTLGDASEVLGKALYAVRDLLGVADEPLDLAEMAASPILELKAGRTLSNATRARLGEIADGLEGHCATLRGMIQDQTEERASVSPPLSTTDLTTYRTSTNRRTSESELRATTQADAATEESEFAEPVDNATLADALQEMLLAQRVTAARLSVTTPSAAPKQR